MNIRFILFYLTVFAIFLNVYPQGLQFHGNETEIAGRSSLAIPEKNTKIKNVTEYGIEFDMRNHNLGSPGHVFYLRNNDGNEALTLIFNYNKKEDKATFIFAINGEKTLFSTSFKGEEIQEKAIPVRFYINKSTETIDIRIGDRETSVKLPGLKQKNFAPQLFFGISHHIVECASFSIRNVKITSDNHTIVLPLSENSGEDVHDLNGKIIGKVTNPKWIIKRSFEWEPLWKFYSSTPTGFCFNPNKQEFYSYNADSIKTFKIISKNPVVKPLIGDSLPSRHGMNFLRNDSGKIIAYEIYDDALFAEIDPETGNWKELKHTMPGAIWHHHAHAFRNKENSLLLFGGYGYRAYSNKLVRYNLTTNLWDTIPLSGDKIDPRFFSSMMMTESEDTLYIYGGKGNTEGKQDLGTRYYYDLYQIDLNNKKVKKLWEQEAPEVDRVPARTLIADPDGKHFYAMMYPEYRPHTALQLYRISIEDGSSTAVGDSIPMISEEIATNVSLFNNPDFEKIYCVLQEFEKFGQTTTSVYSISAPPVSADSLLVLPGDENKKGISPIWYVMAGCIIIMIILIYIYSIRRRRKEDNEKQQEITDSSDNKDSLISGEEESKSLPVAEAVSMNIQEDGEMSAVSATGTMQELPEKNSISLFGPFSVLDVSGRDITYMFSPKLKLVFLYILMNTIVRKGVTSSDLNTVFWADKEPEKLKNLRNVTLNKLRKVIAEIDGINLVYEQGLFSLDIKEECYCDYMRLHKITSSFLDTVPDKEKSTEINSIIIKGKFLADTEDPMFDYYRQQVDTYTIEYLTEKIGEYFRLRKYDTVRRMCNALSRLDPLSEIALNYGIRTARATGRNDKATAIYASFVKDFKKMMGEDYPKSLEEIN